MSTMDAIARAARDGRPLDDVRVIDAHGHLGGWFQFPLARSDAASVVAVMDAIGIDCLAASGTVAAVGVDPRPGNDQMIAAARDYPGRFHVYCTIYPDDADRAVEELQRCEAEGVRALKIHSYHGRPYTAPEYRKAFEHADAKGYPVLAHTWVSELDSIRELAQTYRDIIWICAHCPNEWETYVKLATENENVVLEMCFSKAVFGLVEYYVREAGVENVLYGSDMAFLSAAQQIGRVALADLPEADKRKVLGENAARVLGIGSDHQS